MCPTYKKYPPTRIKNKKQSSLKNIQKRMGNVMWNTEVATLSPMCAKKIF